MGKINIPIASKEFKIEDYIEGGSGVLMMKPPTPLILAKADTHGSKFAMELGIAEEKGERYERLIHTETMIYTLENILYDKADGSLVGRELLEQLPDTLFEDILDALHDSKSLPLTESPGDLTKNE